MTPLPKFHVVQSSVGVSWGALGERRAGISFTQLKRENLSPRSEIMSRRGYWQSSSVHGYQQFGRIASFSRNGDRYGPKLTLEII